MANRTRKAWGSHRAVNLRNIRYNTSLNGSWSGALGAYCGTNLNLCPQSSHFPSPCVTSSHDVRQSWCVKPIEPEHLHGWNNGRLEMNTNWEKRLGNEVGGERIFKQEETFTRVFAMNNSPYYSPLVHRTSTNAAFWLIVIVWVFVAGHRHDLIVKYSTILNSSLDGETCTARTERMCGLCRAK